MKGHKPEGYSTISPYLVLKDAAATIEFLNAVFKAQEVRRFPTEAGDILHAELRIEDSIIMLAEANQEFPPAASHVHIYVADVDASYQRALQVGGRGLQEPHQNEAEQDRRAGVVGPSGTTWWIATRIRD